MRREKGGKAHVRLLHHGKRLVIQFVDEFMRTRLVYLRHVAGDGSSLKAVSDQSHFYRIKIERMGCVSPSDIPLLKHSLGRGSSYDTPSG
jgi:hypothetical protein